MDVASVSDLEARPARTASSAPAAEIKYRSDIDGLRALAVLPVVLFHYGVSQIRGGFVGVDVFFVISGYLISGIIMADLEQGRYSILGFYERRLRRILPALIALLAVCTIVAVFVLFPADLTDYGKSLCATLGFVSNVYFWRDSDYFARAAEWKPLLHTWSLGVEEQFYILFPILLGSIWGFGKRFVVVAALVAFGLSLLFAIYAAREMSTFGFYMPITRAYELLLGFFVALLPRIRLPEFAKGALSLAGLAGVLGATVLINRDTPFPGWEALFPATGAALLILVGLDGRPPIFSRLLQAPPAVFIGKISYSLYLWHWPILVFYKYRVGRDLTPLETSGLFVLAILLAYLSWRFVEAPFRNRKWFSRRAIFAMAAATIVVGLGCGAALVAAHGLPQRIPPAARQYLDLSEAPSKFTPCFNVSLADIQKGHLCTFGDADASQDATFLLWGDSHAYRLVLGLDGMASAQHKKGVLLTIGGCPPLPGATTPILYIHACGKSVDAAFAYVASHKNIRTVVVSAIWALYAEGAKFGEPSNLDHPLLTDSSSKGYSVDESRRVMARSLVRLVNRLRALGCNVVLVGPIPELYTSAPEALARAQMYGGSATLAPSYSDFLARERSVLPTLQSLSHQDGVTVLYPSQLLCDARACMVQQGGKSLYIDDNHLSAAGLGQIGPLLQDILRAVPANYPVVAKSG